jgi:threonine dehydrogenase-like Zn-dependent dehydrogenase
MFSRAGGFKPGAYVCVFGAGPIGLAGIGLAEAAGAGKIVAFEISPQRREIARKIGADEVYDPRQVNIAEALLDISKGEGFDFFFEAAGVPEIVLPASEKALAVNAKVVQVGRAAQRVPLYLETYQVRRSQFYGSQGHSGDANFPSVIRLVAGGRLDLSPIITSRYDLINVVAAIAKSGERTDGKIMVRPN